MRCSPPPTDWTTRPCWPRAAAWAWSRLHALVHVHFGLQDMLLAVVTPTDDAPDVDAASYWRTDPPSNDASTDPIDHIGFLHRFSTAYRRPREAVGHLRHTAETVAGAVERMAPGRGFLGRCAADQGLGDMP